MLTKLWHRITGDHRRNGPLEKATQDHGSASYYNGAAPSGNPVPEPAQHVESTDTEKNGSGQKEDGPFRMHQVPWIAIR